MSYIPDPADPSQPTDSQYASTAAAELRALKAYVASLAGLDPNITFPNLSVSALNGGQLAGFRNKIINGNAELEQRGATFLAIAFGAYGLDRWAYTGASTTAVLTMSQQTDVPSTNEFQNSLRMAVTTADAAIAAGDQALLTQRIEGYNVRDLIGNTFTFSFWVRSSKTGTHCVAFRNSVNDRSYVCEYLVSAANTWEKKFVTVTGGLITAGTWNWTTGIGLSVDFCLAAGTTFHTTANAWQTGNFVSTVSQVNCLDTIGNIFAVTGVQLERGVSATPFEHRPYAVEYLLACRYFEKSYNRGVALGALTFNGAVAGVTQSGALNTSHAFTRYRVQKRISPIVTLYSPQTGGVGLMCDAGGTNSGTALPVSDQDMLVARNSGTGLSANNACYFHFAANSEL